MLKKRFLTALAGLLWVFLSMMFVSACAVDGDCNDWEYCDTGVCQDVSCPNPHVTSDCSALFPSCPGTYTCNIVTYDEVPVSHSCGSSIIWDCVPTDIGFIEPTPEDGAVLYAGDISINVFVDSSYDSSFIDWNRLLKAYWDFEEGAGSTAGDTSTHSHTGTLEDSPQWVPGIRGDALYFDGGDNGGYINAGNSPDYNLVGKDHTLETWFRLLNQVNKSEMTGVFNRFTWLQSGGPQEGYKLYHYGTSGRLNFVEYGADEAAHDHIGIRPAPNYMDDTWHHFAGVVTQNDKTARYYIDGVELEQDTFTFTVDSDRNLTLGEYGGSLLGELDEMRLWHRALSPDEVEDSHDADNLVSQDFSSLGPGTFEFYAYAIDAAGNTVQTETRTITIAAPAEIYFISPPTPDDADTVFDDEVTISTHLEGRTSTLIDWDRSLTGFWSFDENDGVIAADNSTYGNDADLLYGAAWTDGQFGSSGRFDGINDYVNAGNEPEYPVATQNFTIEGWYKTDGNLVDSYGLLFGRYNGFNGYMTSFEPDGRVVVTIKTDTDTYQVKSAPIFNDNQWHHVAYVHDAARKRAYIHLDGGTPSAVFYTGTPVDCACPFNIGGIAYNNSFNGSIDEVKVWNRALSQEEIEASYDASAGTFTHTFEGILPGSYNFYSYATDSTGMSDITYTRTVFVSAGSSGINFTAPTPADGALVCEGTDVTITVDVDASYGSSFIDFDDSLVGYWDFEDNAGTTAEDKSSYNHDAIFAGTGSTDPQWVPGVRGDALYFDGGDDVKYLNASNFPEYDLASIDHTLEGWFRIPIQPNKSRFFHIFDRFTYTVAGGPHRGYKVYGMESSGEARMATPEFGTGALLQLYPSTDYRDNTWHHFASVVDQSSGIARLYIDGVEVEQDNDFSNLDDDNTDLDIGEEWLGDLDELKIWRRALSLDEIRDSFNADTTLTRTFSGLTPGTYTYYAYAIDSSGNIAQTETRSFDVSSCDMQFIPPTPEDSAVVCGDEVTITASLNPGYQSAFIDWNTSLVGYWDFDDAGGVTAGDTSTYGNTGDLINGSSWDSGRIGGSVRFSGGGNQVVEIPYDDTLANTEGTFSFWFNLDVLGRAQPILQKDELWCTGDCGHFTVGYNIMTSQIPPNKIAARLQNEGTGPFSEDWYYIVMHDDSILTPVPGVWYHGAVTYGVGGLKLYINGVLHDTNDTSEKGMENNNIPLKIGRTYSGAMFDGRIDEVTQWSRQLNQAEIADLYNVGLDDVVTRTFSNLPRGNYTFYAHGRDSSGNIVATETRTITVGCLEYKKCADGVCNTDLNDKAFCNSNTSCVNNGICYPAIEPFTELVQTTMEGSPANFCDGFDEETCTLMLGCEYVSNNCEKKSEIEFADLFMDMDSTNDLSLSFDLEDGKYFYKDVNNGLNGDEVCDPGTWIAVYGNITGVVTDVDGTPVEGANVTILGEDRATVTNVTGGYEFIDVGFGPYDFIASSYNFSDTLIFSELVPGFGTLELDFTLGYGDSLCQADCTYSSDNECHDSCHGTNGCMFFDSISQAACHEEGKSFRVPYGSGGLMVQCCEGSPYTPRLIAATTEVDALNIARVIRNVWFEGRLVKLVVDVFD
ncbi:MAG: hypothetical protein GY861_06350 [bacterium]|nr:hypothetical protein [bacterium]